MSSDPAETARLYPTARPTTAPPNVPPGTDLTEHYAAGGYPDFESAGLDYAAGERAMARATENRAALTTTVPDDNEPVMVPNGSQGPASAPIATQAPRDYGRRELGGQNPTQGPNPPRRR